MLYLLKLTYSQLLTHLLFKQLIKILFILRPSQLQQNHHQIQAGLTSRISKLISLNHLLTLQILLLPLFLQPKAGTAMLLPSTT